MIVNATVKKIEYFIVGKDKQRSNWTAYIADINDNKTKDNMLKLLNDNIKSTYNVTSISDICVCHVLTDRLVEKICRDVINQERKLNKDVPEQDNTPKQENMIDSSLEESKKEEEPKKEYVSRFKR